MKNITKAFKWIAENKWKVAVGVLILGLFLYLGVDPADDWAKLND